ncbi:MAG: TatD family hydrolase [Sphingomonadales bacterium]
MLVDSHCHLDFPDFADELDDIVARARAAGVTTLQTICTHLSRFDQVRAVAERFDDVWCSVGVHPHEAAHEEDVTVDRLVALSDHPKVIGIGETGLDYHYDRSPREKQREVFRTHIDAARRTGLPIIIHSRNADADMAEILADEMGKGAFIGLMHCFSSSSELAETALEFGLYLSISGVVTFKKAEALRDIVADLPLDRILVETDAPFLAPVPKRGKRNEPAFTALTAARVAEVRGIGVEEFARATTANFFRLFARARPPASGAGT